MRLRKLDPVTGDYTFGHGAADFWQDQPEAVGQAVVQRLRLSVGDWFLDTQAGTDWLGQVLGTNTRGLYDIELRARIGETIGVTGLDRYRSFRDGPARRLSVQATIQTTFGPITLRAPLTPDVVSAVPSMFVQLTGPDDVPLTGTDDQLLLGIAP